MKEVEDRRIRYEGRRRSGEGMQGCRRGEVNGSEKKSLIWRYFRMGVRGFGSGEANDLSSDHSLVEQVIVPNRTSIYFSRH